MKCFLHDDMDGRCSGALVRLLYNDASQDKSDYIESNYNGFAVSKVVNGEKVFIVDYSFTEDTVDSLFELIKMGCDITWIDHHKSSLELIEKHPELKSLKGIRSNEYSGAALTFMYFTNKAFKEIPTFVKYVSDYDTWKFNYKDSLNFFYGLQTNEYGATDIIWDTFYNEYLETKEDTLNNVVEKGKIIDKYVKLTDRETFLELAFASSFEGIKCWAINSNKGSLIFGDNYNDYPLAITFSFDGNEYTYSLYSSAENVDCAKMAEKYGGGGHKGAAGFRSKEMLLKGHKKI